MVVCLLQRQHIHILAFSITVLHYGYTTCNISRLHQIRKQLCDCRVDSSQRRFGDGGIACGAGPVLDKEVKFVIWVKMNKSFSF